VYWRRRLVVLAAFLAALALVLYACSGSSGTSKQPVGMQTPAGGVSAGATSGASGTASSGAPGATPPASADSGTAGATSANGAASGGPTGQSGGQNGGANPSGTANGTAAPGSCQLKLSMVSSSHDYVNGEQPMFSVAIVNNGTSDCTADVGPKSLVLTVYSGADRIWSTADCGDGKQDLRAVPPGGVQQISIPWPRTRSVPGCTGTATPAAVGTYYAQATLGTGTGTPLAATFTTSQQTFVLKTGS
jgi:hypothetical protein